MSANRAPAWSSGGPPESSDLTSVDAQGGESARSVAGGGAGGAGRADSLPCPLKSHNCTERGSDRDPESIDFPASARRTAHALQVNVGSFVKRHGIENCGFLTLTFADHVMDAREAQRRMHSLRTHVLKPRYGEAIRIFERQKSSRVHYHLLVDVGRDIRSGVDFRALSERDYRSAGEALRAEWCFWRGTARAYGFGRTELLPVLSEEVAVARYLGKYIGKHLEARGDLDHGVRLVSYLGPRVASTRFAWVSPNSALWRRRLGSWVGMLHEAGAISEPTTEAVNRKFGPRWAFEWRDCISTYPVEGE